MNDFTLKGETANKQVVKIEFTNTELNIDDIRKIVEEKGITVTAIDMTVIDAYKKTD